MPTAYPLGGKMWGKIAAVFMPIVDTAKKRFP